MHCLDSVLESILAVHSDGLQSEGTAIRYTAGQLPTINMGRPFYRVKPFI